MQPHLACRLLLDAQAELARAADNLPDRARDSARTGLNAPGWTIAHAAFFLDAWLNVDAQGQDDTAFEPWLLAWVQRERGSPGVPTTTPFEEARGALDRVVARTTPFVRALAERELEQVPPRIVENGWPEGTTVGYLVARSIGHLFAHASELNLIGTLEGASDLGLPGRLRHTSGTVVG